MHFLVNSWSDFTKFTVQRWDSSLLGTFKIETPLERIIAKRMLLEQARRFGKKFIFWGTARLLLLTRYWTGIWYQCPAIEARINSIFKRTLFRKGTFRTAYYTLLLPLQNIFISPVSTTVYALPYLSMFTESLFTETDMSKCPSKTAIYNREICQTCKMWRLEIL